jgi:tetratricopeptide (TPR) repeat protein
MHRLFLCLVLITGCGHKMPLSPAPYLPNAPAQAPPGTLPLQASSSEVPITSRSPLAIGEFKLGRELLEGLRLPEAAEHFKKALQHDPDFAQARAYWGVCLPEGDGLPELDKAVEMAKPLPEAERMLIEAMAADRHGDEARSARLMKRLTEIVPGDWRSHEYLGMRAWDSHRLEEAHAELQNAVALNPKAAVLYSEIGYVFLREGKKEEAVASFKKYADLAENEPNAYDSLADALLAMGRWDEAEAAFKRAVALAPQFHLAWEGIASTRALRADWKGAYDALAMAEKVARRSIDKLETRRVLAGTQLAEGKVAEALKTLGQIRKQAEAEKLTQMWAFASLHEATILIETGRAREGLVRIDEATSRAGSDLGKRLALLRQKAAILRARAYERMAKREDVERALVAVRSEMGDSPDPESQATLHYVEGLAAMASGDAKMAAARFGECMPEHLECKYREVLALEQSGDRTRAVAARQRILDTPMRSPEYLFVRAKLMSRAQPKRP